MIRRTLTSLVLLTGVAHADPDVPAPEGKRYMYERLTLFSAPLRLGGTTEGDGGFVVGFRPELVHAWLRESLDSNHDRDGIGVGGYGELLSANGSAIVGGGLTLVRYTAPIAFAPSVGLYHRYQPDVANAPTHNGVVASVFVGLRNFAPLEHFDLPFGVRVDYRHGFGDSTDRSVIVSADLDLPVAVGIAMWALGSLTSNR